MKMKMIFVIICMLTLTGCGGTGMGNGGNTSTTATGRKCTTGNCWALTLTDSVQQQLVVYTIQAPGGDTSVFSALMQGTVTSAAYSMPTTDMCSWVTAWPYWTFGASPNNSRMLAGIAFGEWTAEPTAGAPTAIAPGGSFNSAEENSGSYQVINNDDLSESSGSICPNFPAEDTGSFTLVQTVGGTN